MAAILCGVQHIAQVRNPRGSCGVWMSGYIWSWQHWLLHEQWLLRLQCGDIGWTSICRSLWEERSDTQLPLPSIIPVWRTCTVGKHVGRWGFEVKDGLPPSEPWSSVIFVSFKGTYKQTLIYKYVKIAILAHIWNRTSNIITAFNIVCHVSCCLHV